MNRNIKTLFLISFAAAFFFTTAQFVHAATLYFSPSSGSYNVGQTFSVDIYVSSSDQAMNAASGAISFPQDKLEVVSLSKSGSVISLWVQEPAFYNNVGTVNFEGIVLNPGFTGSAGKVIAVNFLAKTTGNAPLSFSSGSVLANDGKGTNILSSLGTANFSINARAAAPAALPEAPTPIAAKRSALAAPEISSSTHPEPEKWYSKGVAEFEWPAPTGITAVRLLVDDKATSIPTITYDPPISSKEVTEMKDGIWYFHARFKNASGWGETGHLRFNIDTKPPESFAIKFIGVEGKETDNPKPIALFNTDDFLSGIDYYRIKIGDGDFFNVSSEEVVSNPYVLPLQAPGRHSILVEAFDKAGNFASASDELNILPISAPTITDYSEIATEGEPVFIQGTTYPDATVIVWFQKKSNFVFEKPFSKETKADSKGNFILIADNLNFGSYRVWLEVVDTRGARSRQTSVMEISIAGPLWQRISKTIFEWLVLIISGVALLFLFAGVAYYGWHKFSLLKRKLKKEVREAENVLHDAFDFLKEDIRKQIKLLEKARTRRQLTQEEEKIIEQLKKDLENAEKIVRKEIEDIEKEIK